MIVVDRRRCRAAHHGTYTAYGNAGCRCPDAREDWRLYRKRLREGRAVPRMVDALGTARRLQALAALGWPLRALARETGMSHYRVAELQHNAVPRIRRSTAEHVAAVYERLCMTPFLTPDARTLKAARRNGWVTAVAWHDIDNPTDRPRVHGPTSSEPDEEVVRRIVAGKWVRGATEHERVEAARQLLAAGLTVNMVHMRTRCSWTTVKAVAVELAAA